VWLVDPAAMTVRAQPIAVAGADGNLVVVAGGLQPGQAVVTAGVHTLTPGPEGALVCRTGRRACGGCQSRLGSVSRQPAAPAERRHAQLTLSGAPARRASTSRAGRSSTRR
jgi:hypothetical protein